MTSMMAYIRWLLHLASKIEPAIGRQELQHVIKNAIETILGKVADADKGQSLIKRVLSLMHEMFTEASRTATCKESGAGHQAAELPRAPGDDRPHTTASARNFRKTPKAATG